ncbi:hypothetical protein IH879_20815 [candidate division KSB1 bacterium]|nr:hypothetical protein [candidate division KSB1 bacterium]
MKEFRLVWIIDSGNRSWFKFVDFAGEVVEYVELVLRVNSKGGDKKICV